MLCQSQAWLQDCLDQGYSGFSLWEEHILGEGDKLGWLCILTISHFTFRASISLSI